MKIVVLANESARQEVKTKIKAPGAELIFADNINDLPSTVADIYFDFLFEKKTERIDLLSRFLPKPVFINAVADSLYEIGQPFIRINAWPGFFNREIIEIVAHDGLISDDAKTFLEKINWRYQLVPDVPGMISARIIAMIINEAYYTAQENISTRADIDTAMKLGTNYPYGPFEWAQRIGVKNIHGLLVALQKMDSRYTIAESLSSEAGI